MLSLGKVYTLYWFPFYLIPLFLFQYLIEDIMSCLVIISLSSSRLWQFLRLSLFLMTLMIFRSYGQIFCRMSLSLGLSGTFLMIRLRLCVWRRKNTKVKCHVYHMMGMYYLHVSSPVMLTLVAWLRQPKNLIFIIFFFIQNVSET